MKWESEGTDEFDTWLEGLSEAERADLIAAGPAGGDRRGGFDLMPRKKWSEIRAKAAPETLEAAARKKEALLAAMELNELRRARNLTQEELANRLGVRQTNISRMEKRNDMHISTLREVIEAMGGELEITARFPDGAYRIDQFARVEG